MHTLCNIKKEIRTLQREIEYNMKYQLRQNLIQKYTYMYQTSLAHSANIFEIGVDLLQNLRNISPGNIKFSKCNIRIFNFLAC